jgi:hypothetical protein
MCFVDRQNRIVLLTTRYQIIRVPQNIQRFSSGGLHIPLESHENSVLSMLASAIVFAQPPLHTTFER